MLNTVSKIRGQVKTTGYPQTEGLLGDCMLRYGHDLGEDSVFGTLIFHIFLDSGQWGLDHIIIFRCDTVMINIAIQCYLQFLKWI